MGYCRAGQMGCRCRRGCCAEEPAGWECVVDGGVPLAFLWAVLAASSLALPRRRWPRGAATTVGAVNFLRLVAEFHVEREVRASEADWEAIEKLPPKLKAAVKLYIETGDLYKAAKLAGMSLDEFNQLRMRLKIPAVVDDL